MATKLLEFWVINRAGIHYAHAKSEKEKGHEEVSPFLFSGFLSAVQTIAAESIDAINMKKSKILILPVLKPVSFFVVGRAKTKEKDEHIRKLLYEISKNFLQEFGEIIPKWAGDQSIFDYFIASTAKKFF